MPYVSRAQEAYFHTETARKKGITTKMVKEYDQASKGLKLPKKKDEFSEHKSMINRHLHGGKR